MTINLVTNPQPGPSAAGWGHVNFTNPAVVNVVADTQVDAGRALEIVGDGSLAFQGKEIALGILEPGDYHVRLLIKEVSGNPSLEIKVGKTTSTHNEYTVMAPTSDISTSDFTEITSVVTVTLVGPHALWVRNMSATAATWRLAEVIISTEESFYFDGDHLGQWNGASHASTSTYTPPDADDALEYFAPLLEQHPDIDGHFEVYLQAMSLPFRELDLLVRDDGDDVGWSQLLDRTRAQTSWLRWLGQLVGYFGPLVVTDYAVERERIQTRSAHRRGTIDILREVVQEHLIEPKTVIIQERDTSAHHITVSVYTSQIATSAAEAEAAARSQKAAGLVMSFNSLSGQDWDTLVANQATWNVVVTKFANWNEVVVDPDKP